MTIEKLNQDLDKLNNSLKSTKRDMFHQAKTLNEIIAHCDQEIARLAKEPDSARKKHYLDIYRVRRQLAVHNQEMAKIILAFDPESIDSLKSFQSQLPRLDSLRSEAKFLATEFSVLNYRPIAQALEAALAGKGAAAPAAGAGPASPTGRLSAPGAAQSPSGRLSGGAPGAPGAQRGTGRLSAPPGGVPGTPAAPGAPAAPRPGTGRLSAAAGATAPTGSGRLSGPGTGNLSAPGSPLAGNIAKLMSEPGHRQGLEQILASFQEIDQAMDALRGHEAGKLGVPVEILEASLAKIAGKTYYLSRYVTRLGPEAEFLAFEPEASDDQLTQFMSRQQAAAQGPGAPQGQNNGSLTNKLKSFFNIS